MQLPHDPSSSAISGPSTAAGSSVGSMSQRWWGLEWGRILPWKIGDVTIEHSSFEELTPFFVANRDQLFGAPDERFVDEPFDDVRRRFWAEADVVLFRHGGEVIGYFGAHPTDWSTYYFRSMAILPKFRGADLTMQIAAKVIEILAETPVARFEIDTSIANVPMTKIMLALGMVVTSTIVSERWGTMLRFTKFIDPDAGRVFKRQFVNFPEYERNSNQGRRGP
jgi:RimJ/RimL family protein N-acetyltransferase